MIANTFFDTNILVYSLDSSENDKQLIAKQLISDAANSAFGIISTQVLGEFFHATVIRRRLLTSGEALRAIEAFKAVFSVATIDIAMVSEAITIHQQYQLRYWDALIVATANRYGCAEIVNEDLGHGQSYHGSIVRNPFRPSPDS